jgi:hypothetical protein
LANSGELADSLEGSDCDLETVDGLLNSAGHGEEKGERFRRNRVGRKVP